MYTSRLHFENFESFELLNGYLVLIYLTRFFNVRSALVGLFFPAVTGIMAGSNRSASLKDTQRSIPIGTLSATLTTSTLYLISVLLLGALATREKLLKDRLLTATVAWPLPFIIYVGIILSTLGAALQSLTGAPRLLAAIANDDILPVLNYFKVAEGIIMFLISWSFTLVSLALASLIYYYVSIKGKAGDWGDGFKSAYFQLALRSLRSLGGLYILLSTCSNPKGSTLNGSLKSVRWKCSL
ncbi:hypothetical protein GIB67_015527 [Kingdonia uniflora]|uniref:Amino acid permease/ SLC12A domain-containing protein n=1 Tax=Kingdonia uniflora TaxID=39325 RepID=A0A7J7LAM3_9MAGN|nr:hypothetical protein GIB67_015527 [Kingdonia uniflora]